MEFFKRTFKKGFACPFMRGMLGVGALGLYLYSRRYIPEGLRPLTYGVAWMGFCVTTAHILDLQSRVSEEEKKRERTERILDSLVPALQKCLVMQEEITREAKEMEWKQLIKEWKEQSESISKKLSGSRPESGASGLNSEEPLDFHRMVEMAHCDEVDPEVMELLEKCAAKRAPKEVRLLNQAVKELPMPKFFMQLKGPLPNLPAEPEMERMQYERGIGQLLKLTSEHAGRRTVKQDVAAQTVCE